MIIEDGVALMTEAQWGQKHRAVLKRQRDKGIVKTWYKDPTHKVSATFYREDQTRPYNQREMAKARKRQRDLAKTRKERLSCKCCGAYYGRYARQELEHGLCSFCVDDHTAWQWLRYRKCIPRKGEEPEKVHPKYWDPERETWRESEKGWYYYTSDQVKKVDDRKYTKLKALYVKKFGGWEEIDLETTTYDGRAWW